ncbi:hypothetical protein BO226_17330 [Rhodococcus sp. 2G]|nr:hypothetical protein BO226_17330 [Rhodococcus sp. 2G]
MIDHLRMSQNSSTDPPPDTPAIYVESRVRSDGQKKHRRRKADEYQNNQEGKPLALGSTVWEKAFAGPM